MRSRARLGTMRRTSSLRFVSQGTSATARRNPSVETTRTWCLDKCKSTAERVGLVASLLTAMDPS